MIEILVPENDGHVRIAKMWAEDRRLRVEASANPVHSTMVDIVLECPLVVTICKEDVEIPQSEPTLWLDSLLKVYDDPTFLVARRIVQKDVLTSGDVHVDGPIGTAAMTGRKPKRKDDPGTEDPDLPELESEEDLEPATKDDPGTEDLGLPELESEEAMEPEILHTPPAEVQAAAKKAYTAGSIVDGITSELAAGRRFPVQDVQKIADHFAADSTKSTMDAWGGKRAELWALRVLRKITKYSEEQECDDHGRFGSSGGSESAAPKGTGADVGFKPSPKMERAMKSAVRTGQKEQKIADEQERKVSTALGIPRTKNNSAFDLNNGKVGVELKTMLSSTNGKITMSKAALTRKVTEAKEKGLKMFTVVADKRQGSTKYYVAKGVGSFRVSSMQSSTLSEIKAMVHA